jgi:SAM-dependent methyltransferase
VNRLPFDIDPYANDPGHWGASLVTMAELIVPCLDAAGAKSVVEVGAYAGDVTRLLLQWAERSGARVSAIDPAPEENLVRLAQERSDLQLVRATSLEALKEMPHADAVVIDGDHNYYTVSEELRLVAERADADGRPLPLLLFHDVGWPHARRDDYFDTSQIPDDYLQPIHEGGGLFPGEPGIIPGGLPYRNAAEREGGPRNGVLTAVEDFVNAREGLRLVVVPLFFGLGVAWHTDAPYAAALAEILDAWDRNPLLERLEFNRVYHLASVHMQMVRATQLEHQNNRQRAVLEKLLKSGVFSLAERISKLRHRDRPDAALSKDELRRALSG